MGLLGFAFSPAWIFWIFVLFIIVGLVARKLFLALTGQVSHQFVKSLEREAEKWRSNGLISSQQQQKIIEFYGKKDNVKEKAPAIVIGIACLLLGAGLFLFYGANWKYMSDVAKVGQVYLLLIITYGVSFYCYHKPYLQKMARAFLVLGIIFFGVGIALIAQVYHLASHGGTGLLAWSLGGLLVSWVMKEKWGGYISLAIAVIWTLERGIFYGDPNWLFVVLCGVFFGLFWHLQDKVGIVFAGLAFLLGFFVGNFLHLVRLEIEMQAVSMFILLFVPLGVCLASLGQWLEQHRKLQPASPTFIVLARLLSFLPLLALSFIFADWEPAFLWQPSGHTMFWHIQFVVLWGVALGSLTIFKNRFAKLELASLSIAAIIYLFPLENRALFLAFCHLAVLGYLGINYWVLLSQRRAETLICSFLLQVTIFSKVVAFFVLGMSQEKFFIAYNTMTFLFLLVLFMLFVILRAERQRSSKHTLPMPAIGWGTTLAGWLVLFFLSFQLSEQASWRELDYDGLFLWFFLFTLALLGQAWLMVRASNSKWWLVTLACLGLVSLSFVVTAGEFSWILYSLYFNLLLLICEGGVLYYGLNQNAPRVVKLAIVMILVHIGVRYFDTFFDMLSGGTLFIVTGVLVLAIGYFLEKGNFLKGAQQ